MLFWLRPRYVLIFDSFHSHSLTYSSQSPDPPPNLLTEAVEASQTSYNPLRHFVLHPVHHLHCLDRCAHGCWQVPQSSRLHASYELDAAHQPQEQRHNQPDYWYSSGWGYRCRWYVGWQLRVIRSSSSLRSLHVLSGSRVRYIIDWVELSLASKSWHASRLAACLCKTASGRLIPMSRVSSGMDGHCIMMFIVLLFIFQLCRKRHFGNWLLSLLEIKIRNANHQYICTDIRMLVQVRLLSRDRVLLARARGCCSQGARSRA